MLAVDRDRRVVGGLALDDVVPPHVATLDHGRARALVADPADHEHVLDGRGRLERFVDGRLERRRLAAAPAAVGGDDELRLRVVDPVAQRLGGEPAEDDRVRRADPGAGQHRDGQLRDHRHVDGDPVAGPDAELDQRVGGLLDLALEVGVGDRPGVAGLADPVVGDLVAEPALDVPVDAVVGDVELAADEPLGERQVPLERRLERLDPVEPLAGEIRPEGLGIGLGAGVQVGRRVGLGGEGRVRRKGPVLGQEILDLGRRGRFDGHACTSVPACVFGVDGWAILPRGVGCRQTADGAIIRVG